MPLPVLQQSVTYEDRRHPAYGPLINARSVNLAIGHSPSVDPQRTFPWGRRTPLPSAPEPDPEHEGAATRVFTGKVGRFAERPVVVITDVRGKLPVELVP